jgi:amidophosphoribosyltransferase
MCGLVGVKSTAQTLGSSAGPNQSEVAEIAAALLLRLQHRGQDGAGLTVLSHAGQFETARGLGLIETALRDLPSLEKGSVAIAHTRYATTGTGGVGEVQPFVKGRPKVALAHNGNIVNTTELTHKFRLQLETASDLDVLQQVFLLKSEEGFESAVQTIFDEFNGSYAVVGIEQDGTLFGFRDPFGIRPLFFGSTDAVQVLASESCALAPLGELKVEEIEPGMWIRIDPQGRVTRGRLSSKRNPKGQKRFCMFEAVYFSSPQSELQNRSVYRLRFRLGQQLAEEIKQTLPAYSDPRGHFDFVVPVPDTSRSAALAVAESLGVPYREFLVKNNYVPRTFILGRQDQRLRALNNKLSLIGPEIRGFRILLVDDSVVRGNTSRMMAARLREAGAKCVVLASTCPPIRHGCFYGIDFPDPDELVAHEKDVKAICKALGVDGLHYISVSGLEKALESHELCMACLNGDYPTLDPSFESFLLARRKQREADTP